MADEKEEVQRNIETGRKRKTQKPMFNIGLTLVCIGVIAAVSMICLFAYRSKAGGVTLEIVNSERNGKFTEDSTDSDVAIDTQIYNGELKYRAEFISEELDLSDFFKNEKDAPKGYDKAELVAISLGYSLTEDVRKAVKMGLDYGQEYLNREAEALAYSKNIIDNGEEFTDDKVAEFQEILFPEDVKPFEEISLEFMEELNEKYYKWRGLTEVEEGADLSGTKVDISPMIPWLVANSAYMEKTAAYTTLYFYGYSHDCMEEAFNAFLKYGVNDRSKENGYTYCITLDREVKSLDGLAPTSKAVIYSNSIGDSTFTTGAESFEQFDITDYLKEYNTDCRRAGYGDVRGDYGFRYSTELVGLEETWYIDWIIGVDKDDDVYFPYVVDFAIYTNEEVFSHLEVDDTGAQIQVMRWNANYFFFPQIILESTLTNENDDLTALNIWDIVELGTSCGFLTTPAKMQSLINGGIKSVEYVMAVRKQARAPRSWGDYNDGTTSRFSGAAAGLNWSVIKFGDKVRVAGVDYGIIGTQMLKGLANIDKAIDDTIIGSAVDVVADVGGAVLETAGNLLEGFGEAVKDFWRNF